MDKEHNLNDYYNLSTNLRYSVFVLKSVTNSKRMEAENALVPNRLNKLILIWNLTNKLIPTSKSKTQKI